MKDTTFSFSDLEEKLGESASQEILKELKEYKEITDLKCYHNRGNYWPKRKVCDLAQEAYGL